MSTVKFGQKGKRKKEKQEYDWSAGVSGHLDLIAANQILVKATITNQLLFCFVLCCLKS